MYLLTLRFLLNELARLTVLNTVKRASLFNRDLRVLTEMLQGLKIRERGTSCKVGAKNLLLSL